MNGEENLRGMKEGERRTEKSTGKREENKKEGVRMRSNEIERRNEGNKKGRG